MTLDAIPRSAQKRLRGNPFDFRGNPSISSYCKFTPPLLIGPTNVCRVSNREFGWINPCSTPISYARSSPSSIAARSPKPPTACTTQSAVSMHIRRLEEQLGCALFVKQGRGAKLTAEGESLIDFARRRASSRSRRARSPHCRGRACGAPFGFRHSGRLHQIDPRRGTRPVQPAPPAGRGVGHLRKLARSRSADFGRRARTRAGDPL